VELFAILFSKQFRVLVLKENGFISIPLSKFPIITSAFPIGTAFGYSRSCHRSSVMRSSAQEQRAAHQGREEAGGKWGEANVIIPIIPPPLEVEIGRTAVQGQPRQEVRENLPSQQIR
jgi:hypothetical protein